MCAARHARIHRFQPIRHWIEPALVPLWQEQHFHAPWQLQFGCDTAMIAEVPVPQQIAAARRQVTEPARGLNNLVLNSVRSRISASFYESALSVFLD